MRLCNEYGLNDIQGMFCPLRTYALEADKVLFGRQILLLLPVFVYAYLRFKYTFGHQDEEWANLGLLSIHPKQQQPLV